MQRFSWKLGKAFGIDMYVHYTFVVVPVLVLFMAWSSGAGFWRSAMTLVLTLALFACVALHELGHALMARYFGIATRDIVMLPIGGLARLERMTRKPFEEFMISIAGPAVNVVIAAGLAVTIGLIGGSAALASPGFAGIGFWTMLMWTNVLLVVFNMVPAFPMDGGRVFRAFLAVFLPYYRATLIAVRVGQVLCLAMVVLGILTRSPSFVFVGLFVGLMAQMEIVSERRGIAMPATRYYPASREYPTTRAANQRAVPATYSVEPDPGIQFLDPQDGIRIGRTPDGRYYVVRGMR